VVNPEQILSSFGIQMVDLTDRSDNSEGRGGGPGAYESLRETEDEDGSRYRHEGAGGC
jgi:hypothetical protein